MNDSLTAIQIVNAIILAATASILARTLTAIRMYTTETSRLRLATEEQLRISQMPVIRLKLVKGPDRIEIENLGGGPAAQALLQSFRFETERRNWDCVFETLYMLMPKESAVVPFEITSADGTTSLDSRALFQMAFRRAFERLTEPKGELLIQTQDIFGNCYRIAAVIDATEYLIFRDATYERKEYRLQMGPPTRHPCEEPVALLDRSRNIERGE